MNDLALLTYEICGFGLIAFLLVVSISAVWIAWHDDIPSERCATDQEIDR